MTFQLPASYRRLLPRYGIRAPAGARVSEEGAIPDRFWIVLSGRIAVHTEGVDGRRSVEREVGPGQSVGLAAALSGRPLFAGASAMDASELLAIPVSELLDIFRAAPELALLLLRELALGGEDEVAEGFEAALASKLHDEPESEDSAAPVMEGQPTAAPPELVRLSESFDEESFFVDEAECPISGTRFQYLRTRAGAMRPTGRDSDFMIAYRGVNPTHYSVVVCPGCGYAAYGDDCAELKADDREALLAGQEQRDVCGRPKLCGERPSEAAVLSLTLARHCCEARSSGPRRRAGLLHRQAWLERERGQHEAERRLLRDARDAYIEAFERDSSLGEGAVVRAAYLIGDLALRLADPLEAGRWLETCLRMPELSEQKGLERMARERLSEARQLLAELGGAA